MGGTHKLVGFDVPFNMESTKCKIEWNSNFKAKYLTTQNESKEFWTLMKNKSFHGGSKYARGLVVLN